VKPSARPLALVTAAIAGLALAATGTAASASPAAVRSATAASGTKLWEARFTSADRGAFGTAAAVSPDGSVVFAAGAAAKRLREEGGIPDEATILAYHAAAGTVLWRASYNPSQRSNSNFYAVAVSPDGSAVYATGGTAPAAGKSPSTVTGAYNAATGAPIWTNASAAPGPGQSLAVAPDGSTVFVATGANTSTGGPAVVAFNAATGAVRWTSTPGTGSAQHIIVSPDGSVVFTLGEDANFVPVVAAYNAATGTARWTDTLPDISPASIAVSPDGSKVVVTGLLISGRTVIYQRTAAFDAATGTLLWSRRYQGPNSKSFGLTVTVRPDSRTVYVAGATAGSSDYIVAVWAYNATTGATVWQATLPAFRLPTADDTDQIAVSPDGSKVLITASANSYSPAGAFSAAALDAATGARLWAQGRHLSGTHWHSFSTSMAVSPDGTRIFATGSVNPPDPGQIGSMATVAYSS